MAPIIKVENLSKQYRLGQVGTASIKDDWKRFWYRIGGKEDPFATLGEANDRSTRGSSNYVWALRDIDFEVKPGEVLGIIGRNGAGKSTLLKILSRVTEPSTGRVTMHGRVASLLEVGTGMHPDLTGRENVYLNGAILGMTKKEISRKFDEILDFAGVERYIDTPVKRYSSGMHVRLGFAVAAHLEPEILVVDEVLAVGDAEFQKKCLGKMKEASEQEGRTVLFVSHNLAAVQKLCSRGVLIENGRLISDDQIDNVITAYLKTASAVVEYNCEEKNCDRTMIKTARLIGGVNGIVKVGESWQVKVLVEVAASIKNLICAVGITSREQIPVHTTWSEPIVAEPGIYEFVFTCDQIFLASTFYSINIGISNLKQSIQYLEQCLSFEISETVLDNDIALIHSSASGYILNPLPHTVARL